MLKINSFENASAVNVGQNLLAEWQNSDKRIRDTDRTSEMQAASSARTAKWMTGIKLILHLPLSLHAIKSLPEKEAHYDVFASFGKCRGFKVNAVDRGSSITIYVSANRLFLSNKINYGFGEENGDLAPIYIPISSIADPDLIDSNSGKTSII